MSDLEQDNKIYSKARCKKNINQNRNQIYKLIYDKEKISRPDISYLLGLSLPTVIQITNSLKNDRLIGECGLIKNNGQGRLPIGLSVNKNARTAIGINITLHHITAVLINLAGEILDQIVEYHIFEYTREYALELSAIVSRIIDNNSLNSTNVVGVGISVPGIVSEDGHMMLSSNIFKIRNIFCSELAKYIKYPSLFCNDADAAGYAEIWNHPMMENFIYIALSDTVGGSIIMNNSLHKGNNQRAGEFGHLCIVPNGKPCYCGQNGCLSSYCSSTNLSDLTKKDLQKFFQLLQKNNPRIRKAWLDYINHLAIAVNTLRMIFDCDVILGGYVGASMGEHLDEFRNIVSKLNSFKDTGDYVKLCSRRIAAAATGAAMHFLQLYIDCI